ncbi:MAG: pentapeptide repeat-containing protein [Candidatus Azobacteroides sp.]|nr:pentapeptide repeat-containing protein [Candidatus Azobacteroides sp.]
MENAGINSVGLKLENANPQVKVNWKNILKGIVKIVINSSLKNYPTLPNNIIDMLFDSFEVSDTPGKRGWTLINHALVKALIQLLYETRYRYEDKEIEIGDLDTQLNAILEKGNYDLPANFFQNPENIPFLNDVRPVLKDFLGCFGLEEDEIENILIRFKTFFILELRKEWADNTEYYRPLGETIRTPFDTAANKSIEWEKYYITLEERIADPVFSECFSLEQIYIPLRACYKQPGSNREITGRINRAEPKEEENRKEIITDLENCISDWIENGNWDDCIRIIHGGPGSGKSSFLKMLAAKLARKKQKVLYIPLHEYNVDVNFTEAVNEYFSTIGYFSYDLINDEEKDKLVVLFDGLDELSMQGKALEEIAGSFVRDVARNALLLNKNTLRIQVIIAGRDVIVQQNENEFKRPDEVLRLLPYLIQEEKARFIDDNRLIDIDQRHTWWTKYGELKKKPYQGLPAELQNSEMNEVTAQPLLNYLIALALEYKEEEDLQIDFENPNTIYSCLLQGVYKREYSSEKITFGLDFNSFVFALKEIALCTWHGNGRTATVAEIKKYFSDSQLFANFISSAEKGVISLLTTFYFRRTDKAGEGTETFEFTHKSFNEYLTALKIIDTLDTIHGRLTENENDSGHVKGWNIYGCLVKWLEVFGLQVPDEDLVKYIRNELALIKKEKGGEGLLNAWQNTVVKLWEHVLEKGMPIEQLPLRPPTFKEENEQAVKAEKALLILHGLIADITDRVSDIHWPQPTSFGEFIGRLVGQRTEGGGDIFILRFCNHLNLNNAVLLLKDLCNVNLVKSKLWDANLWDANLRGANLCRADLCGADLVGANLRRANLCRANLRGANLIGANLIGADLHGAELYGANLVGANLNGADYMELI